jgi:hypothetical protein
MPNLEKPQAYKILLPNSYQSSLQNYLKFALRLGGYFQIKKYVQQLCGIVEMR